MSGPDLSGIMKWACREEWQEAFDECSELHMAWACEQAGVKFEELGDVLGEELSSMVFGCVFEDFLTSRLEDGRNIVEDYLKRRGWNESVPAKRYLEALRSSVMSLYEVSGIERDRGFLARDLVRGGEPVRIHEKKGTQYLKPWDRVALRVVQLGSRLEIAGGTLTFNPDLCTEFMKRFRRVKRELAAPFGERLQEEETQVSRRAFNDAVNDGVLRRCAFIFTALWLDDALRRLVDPKLPVLCNTDGHPIAYTTVRFGLRDHADGEAIRAALDSVPDLERDDENAWRWIAFPDSSEATKAKRSIAYLGDGTISMGSVEVEGRTVVLSCNSIERAKKGRALIEGAAGQFLKMSTIESKTPEQMMKEQRSTGKIAASASGLTPDEEHAIIRQYLDSHYRSVLDEPVPMLGNVSPREATRTEKGRAKVVEWLKNFENGSARFAPGSPMAGYDFSWMWDELGVSEFRR